MTSRDIERFPAIDQSVCGGVGDLKGFFKGTQWEADPRVTAFRVAADALMDLMMEAHAEDERAAGAMCSSCQYYKARDNGWKPNWPGPTWTHEASGAEAASLAEAIASINRGVP